MGSVYKIVFSWKIFMGCFILILYKIWTAISLMNFPYLYACENSNSNLFDGIVDILGQYTMCPSCSVCYLCGFRTLTNCTDEICHWTCVCKEGGLKLLASRCEASLEGDYVGIVFESKLVQIFLRLLNFWHSCSMPELAQDLSTWPVTWPVTWPAQSGSSWSFGEGIGPKFSITQVS